jgi:putative membrane protein
MWGSAVTAYLHYLGFMLAFGALVVESQTLKKDLSLQEAWRVVTADAIYGLSATMVLITGILRVLYFGKGTDFYLSSPVFCVNRKHGLQRPNPFRLANIAPIVGEAKAFC